MNSSADFSLPVPGRKRKPSHIRKIRAEINKRSIELTLIDPWKKRLIHLWITTEIKRYIGVRFFDEIPIELTQLCIDLIRDYRKSWSVAEEIPRLKACKVKGA